MHLLFFPKGMSNTLHHLLSFADLPKIRMNGLEHTAMMRSGMKRSNSSHAADQHVGGHYVPLHNSGVGRSIARISASGTFPTLIQSEFAVISDMSVSPILLDVALLLLQSQVSNTSLSSKDEKLQVH